MSSLTRRIQRQHRVKGYSGGRPLPRGTYPKPISRIPAGINRRTRKPHEHKREIARRLRQVERRSA